ncbi:unnamed protein product [Schistosoma rodhaini]|uniref:Rac guanyl-nucleotide exchange factor n=1 Tax=Schistosoma rodhaini TaxID=6188 RepID=A0AA85FES6_9TREM|nr:unnamed protein product [Schistosoma rodhaini]
MSIHIFPTQCGVDPSGSEISTTDSLIQEFQEFEAQVYSGALFEQKCRTSTPSNKNVDSSPSQMNNISAIKFDPCSRGICAKQQLKNCDPNEVSDVEVDSLDDEPVNSTVQINASSETNGYVFENKDSDSFSNRSKLSRIPQLIRSPNRSLSQSLISNNQEAVKKTASTISRHSIPSQMEFPVLQSAANTTRTTSKHHVSNSDFIKAKHPGSNQYFVPNLLTTSDVTESNQNYHLTTPLPNPPYAQPSLSFDSINNSKSCNKTGVQVTVKKLDSSSPSINNLDLSSLNKINMDSIASYAHEDPIETHDLVVAKMAADGVVWVPSNANHSSINTTSAEKNEVHQSILQKTDQLRWYSEEIEEEKINDNPIVRSNSVAESHNSMKHNSSTIHNNPTRDSNVNEAHIEVAQSSNLSCRSSFSSIQKVFNSSNCNFKNSQMDTTPDTSSKQVELEAKLEEAMIIRKQQDDYIKQLQMYYDNLLTKHALAEVTIDQLRMGIRVGIDVKNPNDSSAQNVSNKTRSHSMQALHYNINNRRVSDESYAQVNSGYHQTRNNSSNNNNLHYSSTPLLEQQKNQLKRNSSTHDTRILSVTSDSWETGLGSISNSSQIHCQNDLPNINNFDNQQSVCHNQDPITTSSNNCILGQNHFRKSSDPSLSSGNDICSRFHSDPMKTSINSRRNTIANSCSPGQQQKHQNQMNLSSSSNRNHKSSVSESHDGCTKNGVIMNEEFENIPMNINHISNQNKKPDCPKDSINIIQHSQKAVSTVASPLVNDTPDLDDDMVCGPEAIQMELLLRVADLQTRLSTMELYANEHRFIPDADLVTMQSDYGTLKSYYDLAKVRWGKDPQFDVNKVLIGELNHMGSQLDKLGSYVLNSVETISSPSSTNSSPAPLPTPQPTSMSISDLPVNWKDLNLFKNSGRIPSGENKPIKNTTDSGVLSSPSSLPSRSDHGRLSSVSPLHSPIVEDSLSELESVYIELMQHYNKIKQLPMTAFRAEQLYNLMKRLYDLALTAYDRSSIIASPDELERIFQLDGDTRKLSENLERAIALQEQLSNYQNFHSSESNTSSPHKEVVPRTSEINDKKANLPKDKSTTKLSSSVSLSSYSRRCDAQNNKKNSIHSQSFTSPDSSSNQDSGLSTPPESSDGMKHDEIDHHNHHYQQNESNQLPNHYQTCYPSSYQTLRHKTPPNNSNSQIDHSFDTPKYDHSDSGLTRTHPQTIQPIQPINCDNRKSPINTSSVELNHPVFNNNNDKQDKKIIMEKKSPVSYSSTLSSSPSTKQRINDLENGVRLLKENLENLCLKAENGAQNGNVEYGKSIFIQKSCQFVSPTFCSRNNLPSPGVKNSDSSAFPHLINSGSPLNINNKSVGVYASSELPNTSSLSMQGVYEKNLVENSNSRRTIVPPGRVYHRTVDRRLVVRGQENDCDYSSIKPQTNNKGYVKSKSNRPSIRTLSNNNSRQISHHTGNSRDFSCSRIVNSSRSNNNATHYSSNGLNSSVKYYSTYQLSGSHQSDSSSSNGNSCTSSVSSEYSTEDSPTIASHISSSVSSSSSDDNFNLNHSSRYKVNSKSSMPESNWQRNALPTSSVSKSNIRDEQSKSHRKYHRSTSLCKPSDSYRTPLRSVTNIHDNYGSLNRLNSVPFKKSASSNPSKSKFVHNLTNTFGGSVPVVANLDTSYEPANLQPGKQQSLRVYTAFDSIQRRPQVPFQPSLYFYPSTERILYSHPAQIPSIHLPNNHHEGVLFSPRIPSSLTHTSASRLRTTLCGACGGSGQVLNNSNDGNPLSGRLIEPPLIRPNISLNPLYRKTLSSASLFENENTCRNIILNPSTYYYDYERTDQSARLGSLSRVNKHSRSKQIDRSRHTHISPSHPKYSYHSNKNSNYNNDNNHKFKMMENNRNIDVMDSSEDSTPSNDKHSNHHKQVLRMNNSNSVGKCVNQSRQQSTGSPPTSTSSTLLPTSSALQEILKAASSTSRLAQKLRCSLEDLCKAESK